MTGEINTPLGDLSRPASEVLEAIAGPTAKGLAQITGDIVGGLIGDRIHHWRQRSLIDVLEKTARHIESKGISLDDARVLPDGELYALFSGASKSDESEVREMWAALLATSLNKDRDHTNIRRFASTLEQINAAEAHFLEFLRFASGWNKRYRELYKQRNPFGDRERLPEIDAAIEDHTVKLRKSYDTLMNGRKEQDNIKVIGHLSRLGCIALGIEIGDPNMVLEDHFVEDASDIGGHSYHTVKASAFEALISDIHMNLVMLAGQLEEYLPSALINEKNGYKPVLYILTDYGRSLLEACSPER